MKLISNLLVLGALLSAPYVFADDLIRNERFGVIEALRGGSAEGPAVLLFGGDDEETKITLEALLPVTALAVSVETARYKLGIEKQDTGQSCSYLAGEVERLGQSLQNSQSLTFYRPPWLVGVGEGASLAYATYAEHPKSFSGVVTWGACGELTLGRPLCKGELIEPAYNPEKQLVSFQLRKNLPGRNYFLSSTQTNCAKRGSVSDRAVWISHLKELFESETENTPPPEVAGLPLIELPSKKESQSSAMVVFLSGDGGWATIDKEIGGYLADSGVSVVGFDLLRYLWSRKTPEETAHAVVRVIAKYRKLWRKDKVVLVGFSLGAEHVPFVLNRLPEVSRPVVPLAILLSPAKATDFEVHISDWLGLEPADGGYLVTPEILKVSHAKVSCLYGANEAGDSACVDLPPDIADVRKLPGGHHFDGDYKKVGELILGWIHAEIP